MAAVFYPHFRITKLSGNSDKIQFRRNQTNIRFHHIQLCLWVWKLFDNFISIFPFHHAQFCFQMHWACYVERYRNRSIWISLWGYFYDLSFLFNCFWSPMVSTFLSWFLSSGLSGVHKLRHSFSSWNIGTPVSSICKQSLWKKTLCEKF